MKQSDYFSFHPDDAGSGNPALNAYGWKHTTLQMWIHTAVLRRFSRQIFAAPDAAHPHAKKWCRFVVKRRLSGGMYLLKLFWERRVNVKNGRSRVERFTRVVEVHASTQIRVAPNLNRRAGVSAPYSTYNGRPPGTSERPFIPPPRPE